jgi:hypothetical protein
MTGKRKREGMAMAKAWFHSVKEGAGWLAAHR